MGPHSRLIAFAAFAAAVIVVVLSTGVFRKVDEHPPTEARSLEPLVVTSSTEKETVRPARILADRAPVLAAEGDALGLRQESEVADGEWCTVLVVEGTNLPVPYATVYLIDEEELDEAYMGSMMARGMDLDALCREYGEAYQAGAWGSVRVPPGKGLLVGAAGELWGLRELRMGRDLTTLTIGPDPPLRVRVVDGAGEPVEGVVVAVRQGDADESWDIFKALTDEGGEATFAHAHTFFQLDQERDDPAPRVGIVGVWEEPVEKKIDLNEAQNVLELVLPSTATVEIRLVRSNGAPVGCDYLVRLGPKDIATPDTRVHLAEHGRIRVRVSPGLELRASVLTLEGRELTEADLSGPDEPGTVVSRRILIEEQVTLVGRLIDENGEPLVDCAVHLAFHAAREQGWRGDGLGDRSVRTGDRGRFRCDLDDEQAAHLGELLIDSVSREVTLAADVAIALGLHPGENDMGDVVLRHPPLLVAGTVVDDQGKPVEGAEVDVSAMLEIDGIEGWDSSRALRCESGDDGRFEIRGTPLCQYLLLQVRQDSLFWDGSMTTAPGTLDVQLVLPGTGTLRASFLVDEAVDSGEVTFFVQGPRLVTGNSGSGEVDVSGLLPGIYELRFGTLSGETYCTVEGLQVVAGETTDAGQVDLRRRVHLYEITVQDEKGRHVGGAVFYRAVGGAGEYSMRRIGSDGLGRIFTVTPPLDLRIFGEGCGMVELRGVDGDREVVLKEGIPFVLSIAGGEAYLRDGEYLSYGVGMSKQEEGDPTLRWIDIDGGRGETRLPMAGSYTLSAYLDRPLPGGGSTSAKILELPVTVPEEGTTFQCEVTAQVIDSNR